MERQAGLGRSLEDVLDSLTPVEPDTSTPGHVLFGLVADVDATANGTTPKHETKKKKKKKKNKNNNKKKKKAKGKKAGEKKNKKQGTSAKKRRDD